MSGTDITRGRRLAPLLLSAFAALASPALAESPRLGQPIACTLGADCHIQQFVDRDPGPGTRDFACGELANDGHKGTDFAIPSLAVMARGVPVIAAAPGRVRGLRDGMPDIDPTLPGAPDISGRECGNGVVLDHGDGWESQYCHLRAGSVQVRKGETVDAGAPLGLVGMSGQATFPHVHFALRKDGRVIDPFRPDMAADCDEGPPQASLWQQTPAYRPGGLIALGVLDRVPDYAEVKNGLPPNSLPDAPGALVLWAYVSNGAAGDVIEMRLDGPGGPVGAHSVTLDKRQPFLFRAWGKRAPQDGFAPGAYAGEIVHRRGGALLDRRHLAFTLP